MYIYMVSMLNQSSRQSKAELWFTSKPHRLTPTLTDTMTWEGAC